MTHPYILDLIQKDPKYINYFTKNACIEQLEDDIIKIILDRGEEPLDYSKLTLQ